MAFVSLFFIFLLWPVWIIMIALAFILPWLGIALTTVAAVLLACNAGFLAILLLARFKWKAAGRMDNAGVVWELLVSLVCAALLIFQPWNAALP